MPAAPPHRRRPWLLVAAACAALAAQWGSVAHAAETAIPLMRANANLSDLSSLQRGARHYINYCLGCHSLDYMRYKRLAEDLEIPIDLVEQNLIFVTDKNLELVRSGEALSIAMDPDYARDAFGNVPPDLSLTGRSRGGDWIYTYLLSFYIDESRPYGVNNQLFPDVGMPHVLWQQQGWQALRSAADEGSEGVFDASLYLAEPGSMSEEEYRSMVRDITAFLVYVSEPIQIRRWGYGAWVLLFMFFVTLVFWFLKQEYWRDIPKEH